MEPSIEFLDITGFLATIEVPLVAGRESTRADNETAPVVALVDDTMAAPFGSAFVVIAIASLAACFVPAWRADADRSTPRAAGVTKQPPLTMHIALATNDSDRTA